MKFFFHSSDMPLRHLISSKSHKKSNVLLKVASEPYLYEFIGKDRKFSRKKQIFAIFK